MFTAALFGSVGCIVLIHPQTLLHTEDFYATAMFGARRNEHTFEEFT
jgi:hypothetical protein